MVASFIGAACGHSREVASSMFDNTADLEFETFDNKRNKIGLSVTIRFRVKNEPHEELSEEYGRLYQNHLLLPVVSTVSSDVLKDYSAGEIYDNKRDDIEQKLSDRTKVAIARYDFELTKLLIRSVKISGPLMRNLEREHVERLKKKEN